MKSNRAKLALVISAFLLCASAFAADHGSDFHPAAVKDISDRSYEPAGYIRNSYEGIAWGGGQIHKLDQRKRVIEKIRRKPVLYP